MSFFYRLHAQEAHRYPATDLPLWARQAILAAIQEAWAEALREALPLPDEDDTTAILAALITRLRADATRVPAFNTRFSLAVSDGRYATFNAGKLHKRPDLIFRLADEVDENVGWFVECKIVDATHKPGLYQKKGINRFIAGDYAWAMPTALMIAYAGDTYTLPDKLTEIVGVAPVLCPDLGTWRTRHDRTWCYPETLRTAGPIELHHLWLHGARFE